MSKTLELTNRLVGEVEMAMSESHYEMDWYLDVQEKQAKFLGNPDITGMYEEHEKLKKQIEEDEENRFIPVRGRSSSEDWEQMKQFILSLDNCDEKTHNLLLNTIQGKGAFSRFKYAVSERGLLDKWYEYKNRENRKKALDWLFEQNLISEEEFNKGLQSLENNGKI